MNRTIEAEFTILPLILNMNLFDLTVDLFQFRTDFMKFIKGLLWVLRQ